jgi:hypothetical protein
VTAETWADDGHAQDAGGDTAPHGGFEEALVQVLSTWSEMLETVATPSDRFFHLGGDSIQLARVAVLLSRSTQRPVTLSALLTHQRADQLAAWICAQPIMLDSTREAAGDVVPASYEQEHRLLRDVIQPDPLWRINFGFELVGRLDVERLSSALDTIIRRHEILRSRFFFDEASRPVQEVSDFCPSLRHLTAPQPAREVLHNFFTQPFSRATGDVLHVGLMQRSADHWTLVFSIDHLVFDRQSATLLLRELSLLYNSPHAEAGLPVPGQFRAYSAWQRALIESAEGKRLRRFWREHLADALPGTEYFVEEERLGTPQIDGDDSAPDLVRAHRLDDSFAAQAATLRQVEGVTQYAICLSALVLVLDAIVGRRDHVVLTPTAQRDLPDSENVIGPLANVIAVRTRWLPGISLRELLSTSMSATAASLANSDMPWSEIIRECVPEDYPEPRPHARIDLDVTNTLDPEPLLRMSGLRLARLSMSTVRKEETFRKDTLGFSLFIEDVGDSWKIEMAASGRTFDDRLADRVLGSYIRALEHLVQDPDRSADYVRDQLRAQLHDECGSDAEDSGSNAGGTG